MSYQPKTNYYNKKRVLITGGAGFIGSNLAIALVKAGAQVTIIDSMIEDYGGNLFNLKSIKDKITLNIADLRAPYALAYLLKDKQIIFNLAGQVSHIDSMTDPLTDLEINCRSQLSLLEQVKEHCPTAKIVFASTRQIYGRPQYLPVDEQHPINPPDINGINKTAGEWYHSLYHKVHGLKTVSLRLTNTFGPRQLMHHGRQGFIPVFIRLLIEGKGLQLFGDGLQIRDINYVDDVVSALLLAGEKPKAIGNVYNLGGEPISLLDLVKKMIKINGMGSYSLTPFPEEKKKIDIGDFYGDYTLINKHLGWTPQVSLDSALKKTFAFYRKYSKYYW